MLYIVRTTIGLVSLLTLLALPQISFAKDNLSTLHLKENERCETYFTKYERHHALPARILKAIATQESGRWNARLRKREAWPWTINVAGKGFYFPTKAKAIAEVKRLQAQGAKSIDVGCMQVNLRYHPDAFRNLEEAFTPATNVGYAAKLLKSHYNNLSSWKLAVASYHAGGGAPTSPRGRAYAQKVLTFWRAEINSMFTEGQKATLVAARSASKVKPVETRKATEAPRPVKKLVLVHNDAAIGTKTPLVYVD